MSVMQVDNDYNARNENKTRPHAFVFLVMKDFKYAAGAIVAAKSLRLTNTVHKIVCMITRDIPHDVEEKLKTVFDEIVVVPYISHPTIKLRTVKQQKMYQSWIEFSFTKWNMLNMTQYNKVMFVDADKIVVKNIDHLFDIGTPAGTFSSPWAKPFETNGLFNPYSSVKHGGKISPAMVSEGLSKDSFVCVATMVMLSTSQTDYDCMMKCLKTFPAFGYKNCFSAYDEQILAHYYSIVKQSTWIQISQLYNFIPWKLKWIKQINESPFVFHYFNIKPWNMKRTEWPDLEPWWRIARKHTQDYPLLDWSDLFNPQQFETTNIGCSWCNINHSKEWTNHSFINDACKITCNRI